MSVLIKGMEMPTTCCNCKFREPFMVFAYCHLAEMDMEYEESDNCRHPKCPLVEIPTPHGRLIDADAVNKAMDERIKKLKDDRSIYEASCVSTALDMFAPTVIEAEGRE